MITTKPAQRAHPAPRRRHWGRIVITVLAIAALLGAGLAALVAWVWARAATSTVGEVDFARPLAIPPVAESRVDASGRRVFDLRLQEGRTDFGQGGAAETWGVNGTYLGPTLRAARGEDVQINVTNDVGETTTLHWHGMHLPARMDGGPHQMIEPGSTWSPTWTIDQPAATLWYHPHLHGETARHVYRGLAGLFIVDDPKSRALPLPSEYGVDDIPVIVQDKKFTRDGRLSESGTMFSPVGMLGDTVVVNGTVGPYQEVTTERVRLRLLNGSNARIYNFGFADDRSIDLIGTDGGLLSQPFRTDRVQLSPGDRAEIVVAMQPGERVVLRSYPAELGAGILADRFAGGDDTLDVLELRAAAQLASSPEVPERLVDLPVLAESDATTTRTFRLSGTTINGRAMDLARVDEVVTVGTTEIWEVTNRDGAPHNFHVHDVQFQVLDGGGGATAGVLGGWQDTVFVPPGTTLRLIMRFSDYTDPNSPYMFHCHLLMHEDQGMMGQFVVVEPGASAGPVTARTTAGHGLTHR